MSNTQPPSRDHFGGGTWKKRPPNRLQTLSLPAKYSCDLNVHCRSSSDLQLLRNFLEIWNVTPHSPASDEYNMTTSSDNKEQTENYRRLILSFPAKFSCNLCMHCRSCSDSMLLQKVLETWNIPPLSSSTQHKTSREKNEQIRSSKETHTTKHSNNKLILHTPGLRVFKHIQSVCILFCVYSMSVCFYTTIFLIERTICIYATYLFMEYCVKATVYNFLLRSLENKGNVTPGLSKKVPPTGVDPPFPHCSQANSNCPRHHGSDDVEENAACCIRPPLISTSGCRLSSHSHPIHDVYTRSRYTLGESATPSSKHYGSCPQNHTNRYNYNHMTAVRPNLYVTSYVIKTSDNSTFRTCTPQNEQGCSVLHTRRPRTFISKNTLSETDSYSRLSTPTCAANIKTNDTNVTDNTVSVLSLADSDSETCPFPSNKHAVIFAMTPLTQIISVLQRGLSYARAHTDQEPRDGECDGKTTGCKSSSSSAGSHVPRATARTGFRRNRNGQISGDDEDDDGDKDRNHHGSSKINSQCENEIPLNLTPIKTKLDPKCIDITVNQEDLGDSTLLGRLSRQLMDTFNNITLFGAGHGKHETSGDADSTFSLNISIASVSQLDQTNALELPRALDTNWPTPIIHITPAKTSQDDLILSPDNQLNDSRIEDGNQPGDCYFTGRGNPTITPVNRQNLLLLPRSCKARLRSRSFSSNRPYRVPPAEVIKKRLRLKVDSQLADGTPVRRRSPSESDINFSESFEIPRNEISCIRIQEEGYHDCSTGREFLIHLKHDFLQAEASLSRPSLILALENALRNGQPVNSSSYGNSPDKVNELQRTVTKSWDHSVISCLLEQLGKQNPEDIDTLAPSEDPLLYLLGKMIVHQRDISTTEPKTILNSIKITSMVGRGQKLTLNDVNDATGEEPSLILHMGKERAVNIIPKKLNLAMLDVFDVQLGNFSMISIFPKTRESMHISLPKEKCLEDDDLDLHILVKLECADINKGNVSAEQNGENNKNELAQTVNSSKEDDQATEKDEGLDSGKEAVEKNEAPDSYEQAEEKNEDQDSDKESEEKHEDSDSDKQAAEKDENSDKEAAEKNEDLDPDKETTEMNEDHSVPADQATNEDVDSDKQSAENDEDSDKEAAEKNEDLDSDKETTSTEMNEDSVPADQATNENVDSDEQAAEKDEDSDKEAAEKNEDLNSDVETTETNEEHDVQATEKNEESAKKGEDAADKLNALKSGKSKSQPHWDTEEFPIFLRKETYQTIVANRTKSCTIKKWIKYCNITSLKNNVKNKEALLKHLASIEIGDTRASTSIISGLVEKLNGSSIEQELKLHKIDWDPREHVSVASKKLLLRTTLTWRQEHFHDGSKSSIHPSCRAKPRGTQAEESSPELLEDNSSDSSSAEEDEDAWDSPDDRNSKNEKILQYLKKPNGTATKFSNKAANTNKTKKATTSANKKTCELNEQRGKTTTNCTNCESNEGALKVLESSILRLQEEMNRQKVNMDHMAKQLLEQESNKNIQDQPKSKSKDDLNCMKKLFEQRTKTIFDTINVQQTCLDQITESISKNEKTVSKLRNKIESTVTSNQQAHDDHKAELRKMADTIRNNEEDCTEMKKQLGVSTNTNAQKDKPPGNILDPTSQAPQNLLNQLNVINSKLDLLSEKFQQSDPIQQNRAPTQMSMLLVMACALWKENQELKMKDALRSREPAIDKKSSDETVPTAKSDDFLIKEKEIEAKSKTEHPNRRRHRKDQENFNNRKSEVSSQVNANVHPPALNHVLLPDPAMTVSYLIGETTETKKVLLETPSNSQRRTKMLGKGSNQSEEMEKTRKNNQESKAKPDVKREDKKVTKILKPKTGNLTPRESNRFTLTQGMQRMERNDKPHSHEKTCPTNTNAQSDSAKPAQCNNELNSDTERKKPEKIVSNGEKYRTHKCMIVHDPFLKNFDAERFSQWFDVTRIQFHSINEILKKGSLISKINALSPEIVYLHIGFGDLLNKTEGDSIIDMYKQLIYKLLESSKAKICVSLMIPVLGYPETNSRLKQINKIVSDFITQLRNQTRYEDRIFTNNNDALSGFVNRTSGPRGVSVALNERGQKKLFIRIRECLQRSLGHINPRRNKGERTDYSRNNLPL